MKKMTLILLPLLLLLTVWNANISACVGRTLTIGALEAADEKLLAQLLAVIINERTGTTVVVEHYGSQQQLHAAAKAGKVSILIENTGRALQLLGKPVAGDQEAAYLSVKEQFKERFDFVLLKPFGKSSTGAGKGHLYVPVIPASILLDYPALPRVINRLAGVTEEREYPELVSSVSSGGKANRIARDFLLKKRFI